MAIGDRAQHFGDRRLARRRRTRHAGDIVGAVVAFGEREPGTHAQQRPDRRRAIGAAGELLRVFLRRIVERSDQALVQRDPDQHRRHALGHRERQETRALAAPVAIALGDDLAVLQDQQPRDALALQVVVERIADVAESIVDRGLRLGHRQRHDFARAVRHRAQRHAPDLVHRRPRADTVGIRIPVRAAAHGVADLLAEQRFVGLGGRQHRQQG